LGNLSSSAWEKVSFKVFAPETAQADSYSIMYQINYRDSAGPPHAIGLYGSLEVKPSLAQIANPISHSLYLVIFIVAVVAVVVISIVRFTTLGKSKERSSFASKSGNEL